LVGEIADRTAPAPARSAEGESLGGLRIDQVDQPCIAPWVLRFAARAFLPFALIVVTEFLALGQTAPRLSDTILGRLTAFPPDPHLVASATRRVPVSISVASLPAVQRQSENLSSVPRIVRSPASLAASFQPSSAGIVCCFIRL